MPVVRTAVKLQIIAILLVHLLVQPGYAFGAKAHRIAGHIAEQHLCAASRNALAELAPGVDLAEAGLWADRIRGDRAWDFARPWHYINVPDNVAISAAQRRDSGDVVAAIRYFHYQLAQKELSAAKRRIAFFMLVHFVVDVHQPLHVGRREDLGGNLIRVRAGDYNGNLHQFWDSQVLAEVRDPVRYAAELGAEFVASAPDSRQTGVLEWAAESQALRPEVYSFGRDVDAIGRLTERYEAMARRIVRQRLLQAGRRLAASLNEIWCGESG